MSIANFFYGQLFRSLFWAHEEVERSFYASGVPDYTGYLADGNFAIPESQKKTIEFAKIIEILRGALPSPSALAGIQSDELCATIQWIDKVYRDAVVSYRIEMHEAIENDGKVITRAVTALKSAGWIRDPSVSGLKFVGETCIDVGRVVFCARKPEIKLENYSGYRIGALMAINAKEKDRIEEIGKIIINRVITLITEIKKLESSNQICNRRQNELIQIARVFKAHFPRHRFQINGINVDKYLK